MPDETRGVRAAPRGLADVAADEIRHRILACDLRPASIITVHQLAPELGMSRTPVHQALKMLSMEGLVSAVPRVGYRVSPITRKEVQETFQLRVLLEPFGVRLALARATDADLRSLQQTAYAAATGQSTRSVSVDDDEYVQRLGDVHDEFHLAVALLSGNAHLVEIVRALLQASRRARAPHMRRWDRNVREGRPAAHARVADAMASRDAEKSARYMEVHVRCAASEVAEALSRAEVSSHAERARLRST